MCLWILTACLGLLPGNPSPAVQPAPIVLPGLPAPIVVPAPTQLTIVPPTTAPPPVIITLPPTTLPPAPTTAAVLSSTLQPASNGVVIPLVICSNPEIVCVFNPNDLKGKTIPLESRVGTTFTPAAALHQPPITGYSAQVPSFNTAVKFPRSRRSTRHKYIERVKYYGDNVQRTEGKQRVKKRQICACVPIGTCTSNNINVIIGSVVVECASDQDYCCGDSVDITSKIPCGVLQSVRTSSRTTGSGKSSFGENPWQGALVTQTEYVSGTVLIDELNVLTVAHKVLPYVALGRPADLKVRMGEWNYTQDGSSLYQEYSVIKVFSHPNFIPNTLQNDIAVLRLDSAVLFTPNAGAPVTINRACLPPSPSTIYTGQRCVVAGWGHQEFGPSGLIQSTMKMVDVPIIDPTSCQTLLRATRLGPNFTLDSTSFLCAGGEINKDACTGDGGSGLVCQVEGKWVLVGLVSWGIGCGSQNIPGVYINVASFVPWINQQIAAS